jgi:hypothetical protein
MENAMNDGKENDGVRSYLLLVLLQILVLVAASIVYARAVWNQPDYYLFYVPSTPVFWAFTGGVLRVVYALALQPDEVPASGASVRTWAISRPLIGAVMGGFVYLALTSGLLLLDATPGAMEATDQPARRSPLEPVRPEALCALAFVAGYSDRFSIDILERISGSLSPSRRRAKAHRRHKEAAGQEPS